MWTAALAGAWLLVEYPWGFWLFVFGGAAHWALNAADQIAGRNRHAVAVATNHTARALFFRIASEVPHQIKSAAPKPRQLARCQ
jgi:hypothetical protein